MIIVIGSRFEFTYFFDFYENEINTINDKSNTVIKEIDESSEKQITNKTNDNNVITEEDHLSIIKYESRKT